LKHEPEIGGRHNSSNRQSSLHVLQQLFAASWDRHRARSYDEGSFLGYDVLRHFVVTLDSRNRCIRIDPSRLNGEDATLRDGRNERIIRAMKIVQYAVCGLLLCALAPPTLATPPASEKKRIVIAASTVLDGRGGVLYDTRIVVEGSRIVAIDSKAGPVDYDLRGLTVLPGWIDSHVHISWSFGKDGKNAGGGGATPEAAYRTATNAWATLMAGFTTIRALARQSTSPCATRFQKGCCRDRAC